MTLSPKTKQNKITLDVSIKIETLLRGKKREEDVQVTDNTMSCMGLSKNGCKAKVPNLDFPLISIHEDIVTLEVSMDDGRIMTMQVKKPP